MSTFYGGEQFVETVRVSGVNLDLDTNESPVIYTIPTGYYGKLKFAFIGNYQTLDIQFYYMQGTSSAQMFIVAPNINIVTTQMFQNPQVATGVNYEQSKTSLYGPQGSLFNFYCEEGSRFVLDSDTSNNEVKYELVVELYKLP